MTCTASLPQNVCCHFLGTLAIFFQMLSIAGKGQPCPSNTAFSSSTKIRHVSLGIITANLSSSGSVEWLLTRQQLPSSTGTGALNNCPHTGESAFSSVANCTSSSCSV